MNGEEMKSIMARLDRLEHLFLSGTKLTVIGAKSVLDLEEASALTGYSKGHLYRLTSEKRIPHFKHGRKLFFKKEELEVWLLESKVNTADEIDRIAANYVIQHRQSV